MTWPPTWRHFLELGFSGEGVSCPTSRGRTRNSSSKEAQLNRNILFPLILLRYIHHLPHITCLGQAFLTDRRPSPPQCKPALSVTTSTYGMQYKSPSLKIIQIYQSGKLGQLSVLDDLCHRTYMLVVYSNQACEYKLYNVQLVQVYIIMSNYASLQLSN